MKLTIQLDGKMRTVELAHAEGRLRCSIDGIEIQADALEVTPGTYSILFGRKAFEAHVEASAESLRIHVAGREYLATVRDPRLWRRKLWGTLESEGRQQVVASMPGKIVRVLQKAGAAIEAGQGLIVVEAMKMQNEVRSPKTGKVERVLVKEGQAVNAGDVLAIVF